MKAFLFAALVFVMVLIYLFFSKQETFSRVVFISDTHASVDGKDRSTLWALNSFSRIKDVFSTSEVKPTHLVWVGDMTDFLPSEWDIVGKWVNWISANFPEVEQHAVMGNHDYLYYNYPEIQGVFNNPLKDGYRRKEVESFLDKTVLSGETKIVVKNIEEFLSGSQVILIDTPPQDAKEHFYISYVKNIDKINSTLELSGPVPTQFLANTTAVRQGFTESRGIARFLSTFSGTKTKSTKGVFTIGNTAFVLMSMDSFFDFDDHSKRTKALSEDDFSWFERQLKHYQLRYNIVVITHEMPDSGEALGGLFDPTDTVDYNDATRSRLMFLAAKYQVSTWISGHTHPDVRKAVISSKVGPTTFILAPSLGISQEGVVLVLEPHNGDRSLNFEYWSTETKSYFGKIKVPSRLVVSSSILDINIP